MTDSGHGKRSRSEGDEADDEQGRCKRRRECLVLAQIEKKSSKGSLDAVELLRSSGFADDDPSVKEKEAMAEDAEAKGKALEILVSAMEDADVFEAKRRGCSPAVERHLNYLLKANWVWLLRAVKEKEFQEVGLGDLVSEAAFKHTYQDHGGRLDKFYEGLNSMAEVKDFARVVGVLQSSGWGKSRLVQELHQKGVWVVYLTMGTGSSYPPRSLFADEFLATLRFRAGNGDHAGQILCMDYCLAYFIACTNALHHMRSKDQREWTPQSFVEMMVQGRGVDFWPLVQKHIPDVLNYIARHRNPAASETEPAPMMKAFTLLANSRSRSETWNAWDCGALADYEKLCSEALPTLNPSQGLKFIFVFDEARELLPYSGRPACGDLPPSEEENLYIPLRRATRVLNHSLALFMDTSSRIFNFLSSEWRDPSSRMRAPVTGFFLTPPFHAFFEGDMGASEAVDRSEETFKQVSEDEYMVRYGRPLWWTRRSGGATYEDVFGLAQQKLSGQPGQETDKDLIAILGSRLAISVDPSSTLVGDMVASHLMTVIYVTPDRERITAAWPVEPLVSEAAAHRMLQMRKQEKRGYRSMMRPIQRNVSHGLINKGEEGELAKRFLAMHAIDTARGITSNGSFERSWCSVDAFVQSLLGISLRELARKNADVSYQMHKVEMFAEAKILVNSFHRIFKDATKLTAEDFEEAIRKRVAIIGSAGMWGVDFAIPVHMGELEDALKPGVILIQVKNREEESSIINLGKASPQFSGLGFLQGMPYLSLFVNLGGRHKLKMVPPHTIWESVVNSTTDTITQAKSSLCSDMETLKVKMKVDKLKSDIDSASAQLGDSCGRDFQRDVTNLLMQTEVRFKAEAKNTIANTYAGVQQMKTLKLEVLGMIENASPDGLRYLQSKILNHGDDKENTELMETLKIAIMNKMDALGSSGQRSAARAQRGRHFQGEVTNLRMQTEVEFKSKAKNIINDIFAGAQEMKTLKLQILGMIENASADGLTYLQKGLTYLQNKICPVHGDGNENTELMETLKVAITNKMGSSGHLSEGKADRKKTVENTSAAAGETSDPTRYVKEEMEEMSAKMAAAAKKMLAILMAPTAAAGNKLSAAERWMEWLRADVSDQITVRVEGLDCFSKDEDLCSCLRNMLRIQPEAGYKYDVAKMDEQHRQRFTWMNNFTKNQSEGLYGLFGFINVAATVEILEKRKRKRKKMET